MTFLDKTFCASPGCKNECGRKMSDIEEALLKKMTWAAPEKYPWVSYAYFCKKLEYDHD